MSVYVKQVASALEEITAALSVSLRRTLSKRSMPIVTLHATSSITNRVSPVTHIDGRLKIWKIWGRKKKTEKAK